jgi:hypothetical protein
MTKHTAEREALFTGVWWKASAIRALRTAIVVAVPYIPVSYTENTPYLTALSAAAMGAILSFLTSLTGLTETTGTQVNYWVAIFERVVKTVAQALVAALATDVFVTDIDFKTVVAIVGGSAISSAVLAVLAKLPEADIPGATTVNTLTPTQAPVVGTVVINNASTSGTKDGIMVPNDTV